MAGQFQSDAEVLAELKKPFGLAYSATRIGVSLERIRSVRDAHKTEILKTRVEEHKQGPDQVCFQLELLDKLDSLKQYIDKTYGGSHAKD